MKNLLQLSVKFFVLFFAFNSYGQNFVEVTISNNGQSIPLSTDQVLEVKLPKRPSNGYTWMEATTDDNSIQKSIAQIGKDEWIPDPNSLRTSTGRLLVGQSGTLILRYTGIAQGTTVLTLELKRPWESYAALDNFIITVVSAGKSSGTYTPPVKPSPKIEKSLSSVQTALPTHWDWRSQCTPIENQGQCGDCWAYATVGTLECNIKIHDGVTRDISEEFITDCFTDFGSQGCSGGNCAHEAWMASYTGANSSGGGAVYESTDPTTCNSTGYTGTCGAPYVHHETIDKWADIGGEDGNGVPSVDSMKYHIYYHGPIWIAIDASSNGWNNYSGGIWTETSPNGYTDHAVCLVGWVDSAAVSGGGYWILRNSWGSGWGVNGSGYMYISYGSDQVGCAADYIVYEGGISHTIPPVADFAAAPTSSCTGTIQFNDASSNVPTSWLWNFGDGGTSTLQNPSHTYTTNNTYSVTLTATNAFGYNTMTRSSYVSVNMPTSPVTTGASCNGPSCSVTLSATGSGTLNWYTASTGGTPVHTGTSYTTPSLSATTTYYVENDVSQSIHSAGLAAKTTTGSYYTSSSAWALTFDALAPLTINSVTVYASGAANRTIWLENSSGTVINTTTVNIPNGQQSVTLNFAVPAGTGYMLGTNGANNLWRDNAGAVYPYTVSNLVSITGNTAVAAGYYYYFYNWQVQAQTCTSARTPVIATVNMSTGIDESSTSDFGIFPNPNTGKFEITLNNQNNQNITLSIVNVLGEIVMQQKITTSNATLQVDAAGLKQGLYYIRLQTDKATLSKKVIIY